MGNAFPFALMLAQAASAENPITPAGWAIMSISLASVVGLNAFCLYRVLTLPSAAEAHLKAPLEIDTGDTQDAD